MNRRKFFGAMVGMTVVPVLVGAKTAPVFDPVVYTQRVSIPCDVTAISLLDAAASINKLATRIPTAYRLTVSPTLYIEAHSTYIRDYVRREYQADIVVVMDRTITNCDEWSLDACGIKIWSPGV